MKHCQNRGDRRYERNLIISKKKRIIEQVYHTDVQEWTLGITSENKNTLDKQLGRLYDKKIHCSCYYCSHKTKNAGYSKRDLKQLSKGLYYEN